jgi:uncharacterized membrane protein YkvA (DUF1232 family)
MTAHSVLADNETGARFYDRLRERIHSYVGKGRVTEKIADFLLLAPDVFMLLWRLTNDPRVSGKDKVLLGTGVAYYIFPFDIVPEAILGPIGYLDDLVFGVYVLNRMLSDTDAQILREHWSGHEDILASIQKVLTAVDNLLAGDVISKLKKMAE